MGEHGHGAPPVKRKVIEATTFIIIGFGFSQVLRLAGNVAISRLLSPDFMGIVALARVFTNGLYLFSDVGLEPAIIRSPRHAERDFLDTAWTIQVIRSGILALLSGIIAWPVATIYGKPILAAIIPAIGLFGMATGFQSTSLVTLDRELQQRRLTIMELGVQTASLASMVIIAWFTRSIWALLASDLVGSLIRMAWSHWINRSAPNAFRLERTAVAELMHFGKWILVSTAMMFLATQADRILLGKFFDFALLGVYGNALTLAELPKQVVARLNGKVLFPLVSHYAQEPRETLRERLRGPRMKMLVLLAAALAVFGSFGDFAVRILYDERYQAGRWILPMLSFGMWPLLLVQSIDMCLFAIGKPKWSAAGNFGKFLWMAVLIPLAYRFLGAPGAVLVVALNDIPSWIAINVGLKKEKLGMMGQDLVATLLLAAFTAALLGLRHLVGLGLPG